MIQQSEQAQRMRAVKSSFVLCLLTLVCWSSAAIAQQRNGSDLAVEGLVVDANGAPIAEAQVQIENAGRIYGITSTNTDGRFQIHTELRQPLTLVIKAVGFATHEEPLSSIPSTDLRITLSPAVVSAKVVVAAARVAVPQNETAANVFLLDATKLNSTAAATLDDSLRQVPGFSLFRRSGSRTANPTSQGVSLRGIGATGASRAVVQVDGVLINDPFGGWVYWDRVPRESISEVEVVLGGASHLYGSTALAGLVDIETKSSTTNHGSLSASYGNENTPNASTFLSGTYHDWSGSMAAEIFRTDGYVLVPEDQRGVIDTPAASRYSVVNLRIERSVAQNGRIFGTASFFGESRKNGTPLQTNRTHIRQFVLGGESGSKLGSVTGRVFGGTQVFDQNFTAISADRNSETLTRVQRVPAQVNGFSVQWSRDIGNAQTLVAGADGREVRGASDEIVFVNGRASSLVGAVGRQRTTGVFIEDLIRFKNRVFLNLSGRIDKWRNFDAFLATRSIVPGSPIITNAFTDRSEDAASGHASFLFRFNGHLSLVAAASRAFRAPTLNELYRSFRVGNVLTLANEKLQAEHLTAVESGLRLTALQERLAFRGTVFWNRITDPIANVTLQTTPALITRQRQNLGQTRSTGLELQTEATVDRHWNFSAGYLFADAKVVRFPVNPQLEGLAIPQVPRHQFTFQTRYSNPRIVTLAVQGRAASSQFDDDQNLFRLAPYFTLDTFVSRRLTRRVDLFGAVENVLNERYEVGKTPVTTLGPPLLVRVGFRVQFGQN